MLTARSHCGSVPWQHQWLPFSLPACMCVLGPEGKPRSAEAWLLKYSSFLPVLYSVI